MNGAAPGTTDDARIDAALARAIDDVIAPLVRRDGGSLTFVARHGDAVELRATGALRGCPGTHWTARGVVLPALQRVLPSLRDVRLV